MVKQNRQRPTMRQEPASEDVYQRVNEAAQPDPERLTLRLPQHPADLLALQRAIGNQAVQRLLGQPSPPGLPIQRTLVRDTTTYSREEDLGLGSKKPSTTVTRLLTATKKYFLPSNTPPDFEAEEQKVIGAAKYLLGEAHGDGTWDTRTRPWSYVATMREGLKGFKGESSQENASIAESGVTPTDQGLPLEDMHAYTLTKLLMTIQLLTGYEDLKATSPDLIKDHLDEVRVVLGQYATVANTWFAKAGQPTAGTRAHTFMTIGLGSLQNPAWETMKKVRNGTKAPGALSKKEVAEIQTLLTSIVPKLMDMIDTRPMGGGFLGMGKSKQGADPIANRAKINLLNSAGGSGWAQGMLAALKEGNTVREAAMVNNIKAAPAPLFIQIGEAHVDSITAALDGDGTPVHKGDDFDALTTVRA